jgi:hypothetical protein
VGTFVPQYERWRHGGWYVFNVHYPAGFTSCIERRSDGTFVLTEDKTQTPFKTRDSAARAAHVACEMLKAALVESEAPHE